MHSAHTSSADPMSRTFAQTRLRRIDTLPVPDPTESPVTGAIPEPFRNRDYAQLPRRSASICQGRNKAGSSAREELVEVFEGLHLDRVAGGVAEEHRRLFADLALETYVGLDDEAQ